MPLFIGTTEGKYMKNKKVIYFFFCLTLALPTLGKPLAKKAKKYLTDLHQKNWTIKLRAVKILLYQKRYRRRAFRALKGGLKHKSWTVRLQAIQSAEAIKGKRYFQRWLLSLAEDTKSEVRDAAISTLISAGPKVIPLLEQLSRSKSFFTQAKANNCYNFFSPPEPQDLKVLKKLLLHKKIWVRACSLKIFTSSKQYIQNITPLLIQLLKAEKNKWHKIDVIKALGMAGSKGKGAIPHLLKTLKSSDHLLQTVSATSLRQIGYKLSKELAVFVTALKSQDVNLQISSIRILGNLKGKAKKISPYLLKTLVSKEQKVQQASANALIKIGEITPQMVSILTSSLQSKYAHFRKSSFKILLKLGSKAALGLPHLLKVLESKDSELKLMSFKVLQNIGSKSAPAIPTLLKNLRRNDLLLQKYSLEILISLGPEVSRSSSVLLRMLRSQNRHLQTYSIQILGSIGPKASRAVPLLVKSLQYAKKPTRLLLLKSLTKIGKPSHRIARALLAAVSDKDIEVQTQAIHLLNKLKRVPKKALPLLLRLLKKKPQKYIKRTSEIIFAMKHFKGKTSVLIPALRKLYQKHPTFGEQICSVSFSLGKSSQKATNLYIHIATSKNYCSIPIKHAFEVLKGKVVEGMIKSLHHPKRSVQLAALRAMQSASHFPTSLIPTLLQNLLQNDAELRYRILQILQSQQIHSKAVTLALLELIKNKYPLKKEKPFYLCCVRSSCKAQRKLRVTNSILRGMASILLLQSKKITDNTIVEITKRFVSSDTRRGYESTSYMYFLYKIGKRGTLPIILLTSNQKSAGFFASRLLFLRNRKLPTRLIDKFLKAKKVEQQRMMSYLPVFMHKLKQLSRTISRSSRSLYPLSLPYPNFTIFELEKREAALFNVLKDMLIAQNMKLFSSAVKVLSLSPYPKHKAFLVQSLGKYKGKKRHIIIEGMGNIGPKAIPNLVKTYKQNNALTQGVVLRALGQIGVKATPALHRFLTQTPKKHLIATIIALGKTGSTSHRTFNLLKKHLFNNNWKVRFASANAIAMILKKNRKNREAYILKTWLSTKIGSKKKEQLVIARLAEYKRLNRVAFPLLQRAFKDKNVQVKKSAISGLKEAGTIDDERRIPHIIARLWTQIRPPPPQEFSRKSAPLLIRALDSSRRDIRASAEEAVSKVGSAFWTRLEKRLLRKTGQKQLQMLRIFMKMGSRRPQAQQLLLALLHKGKHLNPALVLKALKKLKRPCLQKTKNRMFSFLKNKSTEVRLTALGVLKRSDFDFCTEYFKRIVKIFESSQYEAERDLALAILGRMGKQSLKLFKRMLKSKKAKRKILAIRALGFYPPSASSQAEELLLAKLKTTSWRTRLAAEQAIAKLTHARLQGYHLASRLLSLLELLEHKDWQVRQAAITRLGKLSQKTLLVRPILVDALDDKNARVRNSVHRELKKPIPEESWYRFQL